jgi:hypothetical protein
LLPIIDPSYYINEALSEEFCTRHGAQRQRFATADPDNCSGGALLRLVQADISEADRELIAGKNPDRLLVEARPRGWRTLHRSRTGTWHTARSRSIEAGTRE